MKWCLLNSTMEILISTGICKEIKTGAGIISFHIGKIRQYNNSPAPLKKQLFNKHYPMKTKSSFLILLLAAIPSFIHAQSSIGYTYDAAGNRILREPVRFRVQRENTDSLSMDQRMSRIGITVAPNPTKGPITVTITGLSEEDVCFLSIYDISGKHVLTMPAFGESTSLDLTSFSSGYYLLQALVNDERYLTKIIKE